MKCQKALNLRRATHLAAMLVAVLFCAVAAATDPPAGREDAKAKVEEPEVAYMEEIWKPLGPDHNIVLKDRTWKVLDNAGNIVFTKPTRMLDDYPLDQIGYAGDSLYVRSLYHEPTKLEVTILNTDGGEAKTLETQPLMRTHVARAQGLVFACGNHIYSEGKSAILGRVAAYTLDTGKETKGELPTDLSRMMEILSRPLWDAFFVITSGDWRDPDRPIVLLQYNKDLKKTFSHPIAVKGQRLEFVCTTKDAIHAVVTTPDHKWTFVHFDVKAGKLSFPAFDVPRSVWLRGLVSGDNVIVWGERDITFYDPKNPQTRRTISVGSPETLALGQVSAVAADGRFVIAASDRYRKERILLVYSPEGKLLNEIEVKKGAIEHLKFVSEGKEILVFANEYTARVTLEPQPPTATSTQPTTEPQDAPKVPK